MNFKVILYPFLNFSVQYIFFEPFSSFNKGDNKNRRGMGLYFDPPHLPRSAVDLPLGPLTLYEDSGRTCHVTSLNHDM